MGLGQIMMVICGLMLLGSLLLSGNTVVTDDVTTVLQGEALVTATSIAQGTFERITAKGFDHNYPGGSDTVKTTQLSVALGPDAGEMAGNDTTFNDIDDYSNFKDSIATPRLGKFYVTCMVSYVQETAPYANTISQTFMKRISVSITNPIMVDPDDPLKLHAPLLLSRIVAYR